MEEGEGLQRQKNYIHIFPICWYVRRPYEQTGVYPKMNPISYWSSSNVVHYTGNRAPFGRNLDHS